MALGRRGIYWMVVGLQVVAVLVFAGVKEYTLRGGQEIVLATVPVDPRDLFRGDYVTLRYEISTVPGQFAVGDTVYTRLFESNGVWRPGYATKERPGPDDTFIRGRVARLTSLNPTLSQAEVEYGIESYFVPEGTGHQIEQQGGKLWVKVAVDSTGSAIIKDLIFEQP